MLFLIQKSAVNRMLSDFCLDYESPPFLWQRVTPVTLGWSAGRRRKNSSKW